MKKHSRFWYFFALLVLLSACGKNNMDFDFADPIDNKSIIDVFGTNNQDLLDAFGENNIHFGPVPPSLDGISFEVQGMDFVYYKRKVIYHGDTIVFYGPQGGSNYDGSTNYHHFFNDLTTVYTKHKFQTKDPSAHIYARENDQVYVIGHDNSFTAYYIETVTDPGSGNPTNAILISGTLEYDASNRFIGVKDYHIGKKILDYESTTPSNAYAPGTIEIKQQHNPLAEASDWDSQKTN